MTQSPDIEQFRILISEIGGVRFGIDMEAISEIRRADQVGRRETEIFGLDEKLLFPQKIVYKSPMVIYIKDEKRRPAILIEQPENVGVLISINDIRPLPVLLEGCHEFSPIWAVAIRNKEIILLLDPYRFVR